MNSLSRNATLIQKAPFALRSLSAFFLLLSCLTILELFSTLRYQTAVRIATNTLVKPSQMEFAREEQAARSAVGFPVFSALPFGNLASTLRNRALKSTQTAAQIVYLCEALATVGAAIARAPYHAPYLIFWADLRQLLGSVNCALPYTQGEAASAARYALQEARANSAVGYMAGMIAIWNGQREEAFQILREVSTHSLGFTEAQQNIIVQQVNDPSDIAALVPPRFPQVIAWIEAFRAGKGERFSEYRAALAITLESALRNLQKEYDNGEVDDVRYYQKLISAISIVPEFAEPEKSSQLVEEFARAMLTFEARAGREAGMSISSHYKKVQNLSVLPIVRAARNADSRPERSNLQQWDSATTLALDTSFQSVGFYSPATQTVEVIELFAYISQNNLDLNNIRVFVSNDNQQWQAPPGGIEIKRLELGSVSIFAIYPQQVSSARYWKIHYGGLGGEGRFANNLDDLVRVYGHRFDQK
jgi:hypothetical protein